MSSSLFLKRRGPGKFALAALLCACLYGPRTASPSTWREDLPNAVLVGSGQMRWLGLRIYDAALWSDTRPFDSSQSFALMLTYHRSLSRDRLVRTSIDEIRRLANSPLESSVIAKWQVELSAAFIDVSEGDQLIAVYLPSAGLRLYDRQKLVAEIADAELARAFFGIWISDKTRDPTLRSQLLGLAK